ncbi:MAG: ABC transporter permease subunit, partial [Candidatus Eisenbacteria bacterium]
MRPGDALLVFRKEMVDLLRDRRSILAMVVFPVLIHPILIFGSARLSAYGENRLREEMVTVAVEGGLPDLRERILSARGVRPLRTRDPAEAVRSGQADAGIVLPEDLAVSLLEEPEAVLYFDGSRSLSSEAKDRVGRVVEDWSREVRDARLDSLGAGGLKRVLPVEEKNLASEERMTGGKLGKLLPVLLVFLLLNGASLAAVDLFAGERERKTIETLLTSLVDRSSIVLGKFLAVVVSALTATILFLGSSFLFTRIEWGEAGVRESWSVSPLSAVVVFVISLPLAFLLSATLVLISSHARTYREAQTLLLPTLLLGVVPAAASVAPGVRLESIVAVVPIANVAVAVREALLGNYPVFPLAAVFLSNSVGAYLVLRWARAYLSSEQAIFGEVRREPGLPASDRPRAREATVFFAFEMLVLYYLGSLVQSRDLIPGLLLTLWGFLLIPTLVFARGFGLDLRRDFFLRAPEAGHLLAGILLAPGSLLAANLLFQAQSRFLPVPQEMMESFER